MFYHVSEIELLPDFELRATFKEGKKKRYDMKPVIARIAPFKALLSIHGLFEQARPECGGAAIVWNDDLDIDAAEIWHNGQDA